MQASIFNEDLLENSKPITNKTSESYKSVEEIDKKIEELKRKLKDVKGTQTEVYTRIVGYHRDVKNWNNGKKEEYKDRITFNIDLKSIEERLNNVNISTISNTENTLNQSEVTFYKVFHSHLCRNCPPVLNFLRTLNIPGEEIDVTTDSGLILAKKYNIMTTPSVVLFDKEDKVISIVNNLENLKKFFEK